MSLTEEVSNVFQYLTSLIGDYIEIIKDRGDGIIAFVTHLFTKCLPYELQGFIIFGLFLLLIFKAISLVK